MKKIFLKFILLAFSKQTFGQIDYNKVYIKSLYLKTDSVYNDIKVILQTKDSKIEIKNHDTISNISFFRDKPCSLIVKVNDFQLIITNFNTHFIDKDFAFTVDIHIKKHSSACTGIYKFDGGNELVELVYCKTNERTNSQTINITPTDKINITEGFYSFLKP